MINMLDSYYELSILDLCYFQIGSVTKMDYMFSNCNSITTVDLNNFYSSKLSNILNEFNKIFTNKNGNLCINSNAKIPIEDFFTNFLFIVMRLAQQKMIY